MKPHDQGLSKALKEINNVLVALNQQAKDTEEQVHEAFGKLRLLLGEREVELMGEIERERHQKEKELGIQKEELEIIQKGIVDSVFFSEKLVKEGNGAEIATSFNIVTKRLISLENQMKITQLSPVANEGFEFVGFEEAKEMVRGCGMIIIKGILSNAGNESPKKREKASVKFGTSWGRTFFEKNTKGSVKPPYFAIIFTVIEIIFSPCLVFTFLSGATSSSPAWPLLQKRTHLRWRLERKNLRTR